MSNEEDVIVCLRCTVLDSSNSNIACRRARVPVGGWVSKEGMNITASKLWVTLEVWSQESHPNIQLIRWLTHFVDTVDSDTTIIPVVPHKAVAEVSNIGNL